MRDSLLCNNCTTITSADSAGASLNDRAPPLHPNSPELQQLALNFLATFLVVSPS